MDVLITLDTGVVYDDYLYIDDSDSVDIPDGASTYSIEWSYWDDDIVHDGGSGSFPLCGLTVTEECGTATTDGKVTVHRFGASWDEMLAAILVDGAFVAGDGGLNEFSFFAVLPAGTEYTTSWAFFQDSGEPPLFDVPSGVVPSCEDETTTTIPEVGSVIANSDGATPAVPALIGLGFLALVAVAARARRIER